MSGEIKLLEYIKHIGVKCQELQKKYIFQLIYNKKNKNKLIILIL